MNEEGLCDSTRRVTRTRTLCDKIGCWWRKPHVVWSTPYATAHDRPGPWLPRPDVQGPEIPNSHDEELRPSQAFSRPLLDDAATPPLLVVG